MPADAFYDSREWRDLRYRVLQKSRGCCQLCGNRGSQDKPLHVDHIKPRSLNPELQLAESNLQVLCHDCNLGKSNKDDTDWRWQASRGLSAGLNREIAILASADPAKKAKLEQLGWLKKNDVDLQIRIEAQKQYKALWREVEAEWLTNGGGN
jgi:hypothetical protein